MEHPNSNVVLIHGFLGANTFWDVLHLQGATSIGLPGHNFSKPISSQNYAFADAVNDSVRQLPGETVTLVGYSMGARLALGVALAAQKKIGRLILVGANPGLESEQEIVSRKKWEAELKVELLSGMEALVTRWEQLPIFDSQSTLSPEVQQQQREMRLHHDATQIAASIDVLGLGQMPNLWSQLPALEMPVIFVAGVHDQKFRSIAQRASMACPRGRHIPIPDAGHNCILEQPDAIADIIRG